MIGHNLRPAECKAIEISWRRQPIVSSGVCVCARFNSWAENPTGGALSTLL